MLSCYALCKECEGRSFVLFVENERNTSVPAIICFWITETVVFEVGFQMTRLVLYMRASCQASKVPHHEVDFDMCLL